MDYAPLYEFIRGDLVESTHFGAFAVVNTQGKLLASHGDPSATTYLRSTAKPFQALPFVAEGGAEKYDLTTDEIAILCSSHSGTDDHVRVLEGMQNKIGITEADLMCGTHPPYHKPTRKRLAETGLSPTSNRHNCSGKHTGMLGFAKLLNAPIQTYLEKDHPVQQRILKAVSKICSVDQSQIHIGTDGCSVPTFAMPLYNAAWGMAQLADPRDLDESMKKACHTIYRAMTKHPFMVAGPDRLDTKLMAIGRGKWISKSGAEAYQGLGVSADTIPDTPNGIGIALKISDGDRGKRAKAPAVISLLQQLGLLDEQDLEELASYAPDQPLINYRNIVIGRGQPSFELDIKTHGH